MIDGMLNIAIYSALAVVGIFIFFGRKIKSLQDKYATEKGAKHRDKINKNYGLNKFGIVIILFSLSCYLLAIGALLERMSVDAFTVIVAILLLLPFSVMAACLYGILAFITHLMNQE